MAYTNFLSEIRKRSVSRTNLFEVTIAPPSIMRGNQMQNVINLYADSVSLPGINFATSDVRRYGYGPVEKKPYSPIFNDITISFLVDGQGNIYKYFYKWMNNIVNTDLSPGGLNITQNGLSAFEVEYKDNYKSELFVSTFDEAGKRVLNSRIIDAVPIGLSETNLSWSDNDQIMKINVTFTFFQHQLLSTENNEPESGHFKSLSGLQQIIKAGTAIQALVSSGKPRSIGDVINVVNNAKTVINGYGI